MLKIGESERAYTLVFATNWLPQFLFLIFCVYASMFAASLTRLYRVVCTESVQLRAHTYITKIVIINGKGGHFALKLGRVWSLPQI